MSRIPTPACAVAARSRRLHLLASAALLALPAVGPARANPAGGQVTSGQATISAPDARTVDVAQSSQRAVIDWRSFSIAPGETTQFRQPNAQAVTLNRVTGSDLSTIAGRLRANGQVILVNQSGIVFSQGSEVDTGGLIATTADISNARFAAGQMAFTKPSAKPHAGVVNRGRITVRQAGLAALVAPSVANSGVISATLGRVVLAGAQTFTADLYGDGLVSFDVTGRVAQGPGGGQALVSNTGQITADGGHILLTADAVDGIIGDLVDAGGTLQARSVGRRTGAIDIAGTGQGVVAVTGLLDASGMAAGQRGGTIAVLGDRVGLLDGASLTVSGQAGGGLAMIGGSFHGGGPQPRARVTYVAPTARVSADALGRGNGGAVAIWSDQQTAYYGAITARGGALGGDGGQVEVSGHNLDFAGTVDRAAPRGRTGSLLLDPAIVNIDDNDAAPNDDGKLPTILATDDPGATDHILASAIGQALQSGNVSIAATSSINVNGTIYGYTEGQTSLALTAPSITLGADISVSGDLTLAGAVTLDSPSRAVNLEVGGHFAAGQISGADTLTLSDQSATLQGVNVAQFVSFDPLQLDSGTYTTTSGPLSLGTVTTSGSLVLGSSETDFAAITLAGDTMLDASARPGGVVSVAQADAASPNQQGLAILASGTGSIVLDQAGQTSALKFLTMTGPSVLHGTATVGIDAALVDIEGALTTDQTASINAGTITLGGQVTGVSHGGTLLTGLTLTAGSGGVVLHGVDELGFTYTTAGFLTLDGGIYEVGNGGGSQSFSPASTAGALYFGNPTSFGAITLAGDTSFHGYQRAVPLTFTTIDSAAGSPHGLAFDDPDISVLILGAVGGSGPLASLSVGIAGSVSLGGNIAAGSVAFQGPVALQSSVTVDAPLGASFAGVSSQGGATSLAFTADTGNVTLGAVDLSGEQGSLGALTAASTTSTVSLTGSVLAASITLPGPVSIGAGTQTLLSTVPGEEFGGQITLGPVFGPTGSLELQAGGATVSLSGLDVSQATIDSAGQVSLHAGTYTATSGSLSFGDVTTDGTLVLGSAQTAFNTLTLAADTTLDASAAGGTVTVASAAATNPYGQGLAMVASSAGSNVLVDGAGANEPLSFLQMTGPAVFGAPGESSYTVYVTADRVSVPGAFQTVQSTSITTDQPGSIALGQATGSGGSGLTLDAGTAGLTLGGAVETFLDPGSRGPVRLNAGTYTIGDGAAFHFTDVTTAGALYFGQPTSFGSVTLAADTSFHGLRGPEALTLSALDSVAGSGPFGASFDDADIAQLSLGPVGQVNRLGALSVSRPGTTTLSGNVSALSVSIGGQVLLQNSVDVDAPSDAAFGSVDALSTSVSLAFSATTGHVTLGPVGRAGPLEALIAASTVPVTLNGNVAAGAVDLAGPVSLGSGTISISTLGTAGSSGPTTLGAVFAPGSGLDLEAGAGAISLSGFDVASAMIDTSGQTSLHAGSYVAGNTLTLGNVATDGALSFGQPTRFGAVTLAGDTTLDSSQVGGALALGQVIGPAYTLGIAAGVGDVSLAGVAASALTVSTTGAENLFGGTYAIGAPAAGGGVTPYAFGNVTTFGTLTLKSTQTGFGTVTLGADTVLDARPGGDLALGPVAGAGYRLGVLAGAGTLTLSGIQAGGLSIGDARTVLDTGTYSIGTGTYAWGDVATSGALRFAQPVDFGAVTVLAPTSLTDLAQGGGAIAIAALDALAPAAPDVTIGAGLVTLGPVGQAAALGTLSIVSLRPAVLDGDVRAASLGIPGGESLGGTITIDAPGGASLGVATGTLAGSGLVFTGDTGPVSLAGGTLGVLSDSAAAGLTLTGNVQAALVDIGGPLSVPSSIGIQASGGMRLGPVSGPDSTLTLGSPGGSIVLSGFDLGALDIGQAGAVVLQAGSYRSAGGLAFGAVETEGVLTLGSAAQFGSIALLANTTLDSSAAGGAVGVGHASGAGTLAISAGSGAVSLAGVSLGGLDISTTGPETLLAGTYTIAGPSYVFGDVTTDGALVLGQATRFGRVTLGADTSLDSAAANGALSLGQVTGAHALSLSAGTGDVTLAGLSVGAFSVATAGLETLDGGTYALLGAVSGGGTLGFGDVTTNGTLALPQATRFGRVTLASDTTLDMTASSPLSLGQATGPSTLIVIGGDVTLGGLTTAGFVSLATGMETLSTGTYGLRGDGGTGASYAFGSVATSGDLVFLQPTSFAAVRLTGDTVLDSASVGGALTLGPAAGPFALTLNAGAGNVSLAGVDVGSLAAGNPGLLTLNAGSYTVASGTLALGAVTTGGAIAFGQATTLGLLTLAADSTLATTGQAALTVGGAAGGGFALSLTAGQAGAGNLTVAGPIDGAGSLTLAGGAVLLQGAVGAAAPVGSVAVDSLGSLALTQSVTAKNDVTLSAAAAEASISVASAVQSLAGNVTLNAAGDVTITGSLGAGIGTVALDAGGGVDEQGLGRIAASVLTGSALAGSATLDGQDNTVATLGGFSVSGALLVRDATGLAVLSGPVRAGGDATLMTDATLTIGAGVSVTGQAVSLGAFGGPLGIAGALSSRGDMTLASAGDLSLGSGAAVQAAGSLQADAGGRVSLAAGGHIAAGGDMWVGYGASGSAFTRFGYAAPAGVGGTLTDAAAITAGGNVGLRAAGAVGVQGTIGAGLAASGGSVFLAAESGDMAVGGAVSAAAGGGAGSGTVSLEAAGNIDEQGTTPGSIQAAVLVGQSGGWAALGGQNRVAVLGGFQTGGQVASADAGHAAGSSFIFADASPLSITAATYSVAPPATQGAGPSAGLSAGPLLGVTQAMSSASVSGPGSVAISAPSIAVAGPVSLSSGSFLALAGGSIDQTGILSISAPLALLDVSGVPQAGVSGLFGANGAAGQAAFASGQPQSFLNAYETLIAGRGQSDPGAQLQLADVQAPGSTLVLATGQGRAGGTVAASGLSVVSAGGGATLTGSIGGTSGAAAAAAGHTSFGPDQAPQDAAITFNDCELGSAACGVTQIVTPPPPPPVNPPPVTPPPDTGRLVTLETLPLQPQLVTDATGVVGQFLPGLDPQQSQTVARTIELLPFDEIQQEHALDDIEVDRLDTGREDVR